MDIFLLLIVFFLFGIFIGWTSHARAMMVKMTANPDEIIDLLKRLKQVQNEITEEEDGIKSDVRFEQHQGVYYLYDSNDKFLAQGASVTEAMTNAEKRFPGLKLNFRLNLPDQSNQ